MQGRQEPRKGERKRRTGRQTTTRIRPATQPTKTMNTTPPIHLALERGQPCPRELACKRINSRTWLSALPASLPLAFACGLALLTPAAFAQTWQTVDDFQYVLGQYSSAHGLATDPAGNLYVAGGEIG